MSTMVTRAQVEESLWRICGRTPWHEVEKVMRIIDAYAVTMGRKLDNRLYVRDLGEDAPRRRVSAYLCKGCKSRKDLAMFPVPKRENPSLSYNCLSCQGVTCA